MKKTVYLGSWYIQSVVATLSFFLLINIYALLVGSLIAFVPIVLQSILLFLIWKKSEAVSFCIKAWCVILMFGGGMGLLSSCLGVVDSSFLGGTHKESIISVLSNCALFIFGLVYFVMCSEYVKLVDSQSPSPQTDKTGGVA